MNTAGYNLVGLWAGNYPYLSNNPLIVGHMLGNAPRLLPLHAVADLLIVTLLAFAVRIDAPNEESRITS